MRERVAVRVAIDETAASPARSTAGVADAVCLKISRCGGIAGLLAAATLVRATGAEVYLASTLDGPLGIAAALHAAAALASRGPMPPCGLATLELFADLRTRCRRGRRRSRFPPRPAWASSRPVATRERRSIWCAFAQSSARKTRSTAPDGAPMAHDSHQSADALHGLELRPTLLERLPQTGSYARLPSSSGRRDAAVAQS